MQGSTMLSIIIVTFNSDKYIRRCLNSVKEQCRFDTEVIVIDNGSQDSTVEILHNEYPSITVARNQVNVGAAAARNQGIYLSNGEWVLTLDCDVVLTDDFIARIIEELNRVPLDIGMIQAVL